MIPFDIWKYEIYTYLDYESRYNLNCILKPEARGSKKIKDINQHAIECVYNSIKSRLDIIVNTPFEFMSNYLRVKGLYTLLLNPLFQPVFNLKKFREQTIAKCSEMKDSKYLDENTRTEFNELLDKLMIVVKKFNGDLRPKVCFDMSFA